MEKNRGHRYDSMEPYTRDFLTKVPKSYDGEKTAANVAGKTGHLHTEN
jgi:hypothetical protein